MKHIVLLAVLLCGCSDSPQPGDVWVDRIAPDPFKNSASPTNYVLAVKDGYVQYRLIYAGQWLTNSLSESLFVCATRKISAPTPQEERAAVRAELVTLSNAVISYATEFAIPTNLVASSDTNRFLTLIPNPEIVAEFRYLDGSGNNTRATNLLLKTKYHPILTGCDENGWWVVRFEEDVK